MALMFVGCCLVDFSFGQCGGSTATLRTPVRSFLATRPLRTLGCGLFQKIGSRVAAQGCGSSAAPSCAGSMVAPQAAPTPVAEYVEPSQKSVPVSVQTPEMDCSSGTCSMKESQTSMQYGSPELFAARVTPVRSFMSNTYQQALASAQYRAANRIHGHSYLDTHRTSGVGWATSNPKPNTCLGGDNGSTYAVVQGADGWYATKFQ